MPKGLVKTKADEDAWQRAKDRAHEQYGPSEDQSFWKIVNHIFHKMRKKSAMDMAPSVLLQFLERR